MSIKDFFTRKNNKAISRPFNLKDFFVTNSYESSNDGASFSCMDKIATSFAKLNFGIYDTTSKQKIKNNSLYELIKQPNLEEDRFLFLYNCCMDYFSGGTFLYIVRNTNNTPVSLFRLSPNAVKITRDPESNRRVFNYNGFRYTDDNILYIPSRFNYDTLRGGDSIYNAVKNVFDTSKKIEAYTRASFNNGVSGSRLVVDISEAYPDATEEQIKELKEIIATNYAGIENASRPLFKQKGINYDEIGKGTDNKSADLVGNRNLQKSDVSMVYGVPIDLLNGASGIDLEKAFILFNEFAVAPIATQFEQAFNKLLGDNFYFEFDFNNVLKVSLNSRVDAYIKQINNGLMTPNEARAKENLSAIEAGDNAFIPAQLMPLNDDTINAYMAKQKAMINDTDTTQGTLNSQHNPGGDDKN